MSITSARKAEVIKANQNTATDTGSPEVQIAILTERINNLSKHMETNKKDFSSRRGLMTLVARRRKLLDYLIKTAEPRYKEIIAKLNIRK